MKYKEFVEAQKTIAMELVSRGCEDYEEITMKYFDYFPGKAGEIRATAFALVIESEHIEGRKKPKRYFRAYEFSVDEDGDIWRVSWCFVDEEDIFIAVKKYRTYAYEAYRKSVEALWDSLNE